MMTLTTLLRFTELLTRVDPDDVLDLLATDEFLHEFRRDSLIEIEEAMKHISHRCVEINEPILGKECRELAKKIEDHFRQKGEK